jgi:aspartyl-tRNA(Asn)/glutamyl-tRNA(Gln) amidotransferase subunit A
MVPLVLGSDRAARSATCGVPGASRHEAELAVSRYGLLAFASSLDQIGPFTRTVQDAAIALSVTPAWTRPMPRARRNQSDYADLSRRHPDCGSACRRVCSVTGRSRISTAVSAALQELLVRRGARRDDLRTHRPPFPSTIRRDGRGKLEPGPHDGVRYGLRGGGAEDVQTMTGGPARRDRPE